MAGFGIGVTFAWRYVQEATLCSAQPPTTWTPSAALRDLAAADAGTPRLYPEPSSVNDLLAQVVEAHRETAKTVGVRLISEPDGDPEVTIDPHRLRQLVGNLIANAVRHTPADGVVTLHSGVTDGWLQIAVVDTGTGIAPDDLPRILERFWRADASRSR